MNWEDVNPEWTDNLMCGHSFFATKPAIPDRQPNFLASY